MSFHVPVSFSVSFIFLLYLFGMNQLHFLFEIIQKLGSSSANSHISKEYINAKKTNFPVQRYRLYNYIYSHLTSPSMPGPSQERDAPVEVSDSEDENAADISPQVVDLLNRASEAIKEERGKTARLQGEVTQLKHYLRDILLLFVEDEKNASADPKNQRQPQLSGKLRHYFATSAAEIGDLCGVKVTQVGAAHGHSRSSRSSSADQVTSNMVKPSSGYTQKQPGGPTGKREDSPSNSKDLSAAANHGNHQSPEMAADAQSALPHPLATPPTVSAIEAGMMARLRRAIAPPPSRSQVSDVVEAMVGELRKEIHRKLDDGTLKWPPAEKRADPNSVYHFIPWTIHIEREAVCAYRFLIGPEENVRALVEARRRMPETSIETLVLRSQQERERKGRGVKMDARHFLVNLTIDSGHLSVVSGGGHVNLLEFLERKIQLRL